MQDSVYNDTHKGNRPSHAKEKNDTHDGERITRKRDFERNVQGSKNTVREGVIMPNARM